MSLHPFAARALVAARLRTVAPLLATFALWLSFELPAAVRPQGLELTALRPTGDFLVLVTAYAVLHGRRWERAVRGVWIAFVAVLVFVRIDWTVCWLITRSRPLFYDQLFLVRHLGVLVSDLWSAPVALGLFGVIVGVFVVFALTRALSHVARAAFEPPLRRSTAYALAGAWCALAALTLLGTRGAMGQPLVRWMSPELVTNVRDSYRTYRAVREDIVHSPYEAYAAIHLSRRPNVSFFFVESYGRVIEDEPDLTKRLAPRLRRMERSLGAAGWHMASGFSTAPVSGGRSWLAVGSIFMGTPVQYESVFRHLVGASPSVPSIPWFFASSGYETIGLEPSDRVRPGVEDVNYYHLARQIRFDDLHYNGKSIGWGLVPDQYSLGYAADNVLGAIKKPRFFMFHMVSSHMPWSVVPKLVGDWHELGAADGEAAGEAHGDWLTLRQRLHVMWSRLGRYGRDDDDGGGEARAGPREPPNLKGYAKGFRHRYVDTVAYDLSLIEQHLLSEASRKADELVIVMGDHQPPAVTSDGENFDVPVHVFASDPALLAEFAEHGFTPGLSLDAKAPPAVEHAGFFSLLVRDLVRGDPSGQALPRYLPHGVSFSGG